MGVKHLVDTHVLLWLLSAPDRIAEPARRALADRSNLLLVSAASALEIATKARLGKLNAPEVTAALPRRLDDMSADVLPITLEHAMLAGSMSWEHRDPFDRLLVAQATLEDATLVTVDAAIVGLPVPRILTW
jgi:PIN domain nuclease of toxin-antitoxin system